MGDGEQQEGNIWEAVMEGSHYKLDNLVGIIDRNRLQIDGWVKDVMNVEPLAERYRSFGWEVIEVDGHNIREVVDGLQKAKNIPVAGKPTLLLANTVKGKGVSFMENVAGWHGRAPTYDEMVKGLDELGLKNNIAYDALLKKAAEYQKEVEAKLDAKMPHFSRDYWWNAEGTPKVEMEPTRKGFGKSLANNGDDERIVCLGLDISGSITISDFYSGKPERKNRWISMGIAEQSATAAAAGLAREGKLPVFGTYGTFAAARNLDQIRVSICYGNFNVHDRRRARRRLRRPGRRDAPGAGRPVRHVRAAQHGGFGAVRRHRNPQGDGLPAAGARRAEVHPLRARGDADRDHGRHAVRVRQGERHRGCGGRPRRWSTPSTPCSRPSIGTSTKTSASSPAGRWFRRRCARPTS